MTAVIALWGAVAFAAADAMNLNLTRQLGVASTLVWVLAVAVGVTALAVATIGVPSAWQTGALVQAALAGMLNVAALASLFAALRRGRLSIVAPIVALDGGFAALAAIILGERVGPTVCLGLVLAVFGGVLAASDVGGAGDLRFDASAGWALVSAACFAGTYLLYGRPDGGLEAAAWVAVSLLSGLACVLTVAGARSELTVPRGLWFQLVISGGLEMCGLLATVTALQVGPVSTAAVLLAQGASVGALFGAVLLRERLKAHQWIGVALTAVAASLLATGG